MSSSLLQLITSTLISQGAFSSRTNQTHVFIVACKDALHDHNHNQLIPPKNQKLVLPNVDRRNLLVGLGGLCTTASLTSFSPAIAAPITTPDIMSICKDVISGVDNVTQDVRTRKCCPPNIGKKIKPFMFVKEKTLRVRWPAHNGSLEQVENYRNAIQAMRDLPEDHPHSFNSQAKIHCAYCNGYYTQIDCGFPDIDIQIHNSWLFFPFHRWFLYFHERILGKLINDPTFALPFWKWDDPAGMRIPEIFLPKDINGKPNPLYDEYRDARHIEKVLVDLDYDKKERGFTDEMQIACNAYTLYRDLIRNGGDTISFFGGVYVAGDSAVSSNDPSVGSLESGSYNAVHRWVGDATKPYSEDMGNFYSAAYDPVFYTHHANLDRLWKLWKDLGIPGHKEPTDRDWLNASYVFYDENEELVRVYNKDSVNLAKMRYDYIDKPEETLSWHKSRPTKCIKSSQVVWTAQVEKVTFPVNLNKILTVRVKRPGVDRSVEQKAKANEVLVIKRIKFDSGKFVKFDVFVNDMVKEGDVIAPSGSEYAGCFTQIPHDSMENMFLYSSARFGLNELLDDTNNEGEVYVRVMLVPRVGCNDLTVGEINIKLVPIL